tara:strand:- start:1 stop:186 length:186 start_codon:yes stop_codon:yes gene_type:complete
VFIRIAEGTVLLLVYVRASELRAIFGGSPVKKWGLSKEEAKKILVLLTGKNKNNITILGGK